MTNSQSLCALEYRVFSFPTFGPRIGCPIRWGSSWCNATTAATSSMGETLATAFSPFFPKMHKAMRALARGAPRSQGAHTALTAPTKSLPSGLKLHQKNNGATRRSCWWPWLAKQTIASSNMLPWHSCHWVRTAAYQTKAPFIKNVARASRWLYCEDALHRRFEAGHSAPTEIQGRLPPSPYRPRRHMGGGRSPVL